MTSGNSSNVEKRRKAEFSNEDGSDPVFVDRNKLMSPETALLKMLRRERFLYVLSD